MTPESRSPLRCAVVGARRGRTFAHAARSQEDGGVQLVAICDPYAPMLEEWHDTPDLRLYSDYAEVLNDPEIDAVCIATPVTLHAAQAIAALRAGKHVLSEVTAAYTLEEAFALRDAVEQSGRTYMMAENYCYMEPVLQVQRMVEEGIFGDLVYASGSYLHDCRQLFFREDGEPTWRGELHRHHRSNTYPTHSLGPVARWLGINRTDRLTRLATWASPSRSAAHFAKAKFGADSQWATSEAWKTPDTVTTSLQTERGILIDLRIDWASARPHHMTRYELQGTKAAFTWPEGGKDTEPLIWIEGRSPVNAKGEASEWEPLSRYREEYQHPLWREHRERAGAAGHGGGDFFVLREFASAIRENRRPMIDVYDAITWSSITPLSARSLAEGNAPVEVPDFTRSHS